MTKTNGDGDFWSKKWLGLMGTLIGFISGIVSGAGMGGGTILILCLTLFYGIEQHKAQATNLAFFIPTAIAAICVSIKEKNIKWKEVKSIIISGIIGAIIGAKFSNKLEVNTLRKYFGFFLAFIAIYEIYCYIKKYILSKNTHTKNVK